jgi:pimeloyl-ACP methyl ester carboxylesterase
MLCALFHHSAALRAETASRVDAVRPAADVWQGERRPVWITSADAGAEPILVYPPAEDAGTPARLVLLLHGMCGHPENECPSLAGPATRDRFVACPRADLACPSGGSIWSGSSSVRRSRVEEARLRIDRAFPGRVAADDATLVGFSLGSFVALDVAEHSPGLWPHVVLIGARVTPRAHLLEMAGVESLLFASGDWDMSRDSMRVSARALERHGFRAAYMGLGPVGHAFALDMNAWMSVALGWGDG